ncbi:hypothetical protein GGQ04_003387, partial [Salinibacter ruber]|nr:hypothetical protein [Salinibacter ruber]
MEWEMEWAKNSPEVFKKSYASLLPEG